jgi:sporulation protein YlmC with PRC-barrel domain
VLAKLTAEANGGQAAEPSKTAPDTVVVEGATQTNVVEQPAQRTAVGQPVQREAAARTIVVEQPRPEVVVNQATPEILVRQPAPIITIDIPPPEIIVQMPDPAVSVSQGKPQVQVAQPAEVVVSEGAAPEVQIGRAEKPVVRYEREEPQVRINQAEGEPTVQFRSAMAEETAAAASVEITGSVNTADARQETARAIVVSSLAGLEVVNTVGEKVGTVDRLLVSDQDGRFYLVITHGGFLGLGEAEALLPLDTVSIWGDRLAIRDLTDDQIRQLPGWSDDKAYREVDGHEVAQITVAGR